MLMYSTASSRSEPPPRFTPGVPEGLWEGVLLFPMDTSHVQENGPASLASQVFWEAFIRVYPLSPSKGWRRSLVALTFPPAMSTCRELWLPSTTVPSQGTSPVLTTLTGISPPATLLHSHLRQQIMHQDNLPGFIAVQTFKQTMQNTDENWIPVQCRYIVSTPGQLHTECLSISLSHE